MSTKFSNSEILPPKLKYKIAARLESANHSESSSYVTKKSPSSTINDRPKTTKTFLKYKSALKEKYEDETKTYRVKHEEESSKMSYSTKRQVEAIDVENSSKTIAKRRTCYSTKSLAEVIDVEDVDWTDDIPLCPTYYPSKEEFQNPMAYLQKISLEASPYGICRIVSPISPIVSPSLVLKKEDKPEKFAAEYLPLHAGYREGVFETERKYKVNDFETMANDQYECIYKVAAQLPSSLVEKDFWRKIGQENGENVEYVNGLTKSAFSSDPSDPLGRSHWNLKKFARLAQSSLRLLEHDIEGVTNPLLFLGMLFSYIFWSAEPGHLYSIEYHHCGAPRTWYGSPGSASYDFERVVKEIIFPEEGLQRFEAYDILDFKAMLFSPNIMLKQKVPMFKTMQYPGEFVITFPKAYHMGINHGFNCWEAARFSTSHWFPFGEEASERRALYNRPQVVPYQELLCKEAMSMFVNKKRELESHSYRDLKVNFASLIRLHHFACEEIKTRGGAHVRIAPYTDDIMFCGACHRECHLAYVTCKCFPDPICIFHDIYDECRCKRTRVMSIREEIIDMQNVAKSLESDDEHLLADIEELVSIRGVTFGCRPRMELNSDLEELISIETECSKFSPPGTMKPQTNYQIV